MKHPQVSLASHGRIILKRTGVKGNQVPSAYRVEVEGLVLQEALRFMIVTVSLDFTP